MARKKQGRVRWPAPTDAVVKGCLAAIKRGDMAAAGALADRLEEIGHGIAPLVRKAVTRWANNVHYFQTYGTSVRRKSTRWEAIASWHRWLRWEIRRIWGRKWKWQPLTPKQLDDANAGMSVVRDDTQESTHEE